MFLLNTLNLLLDSDSPEESRFLGQGSAQPFPEGQLTSAAWEGWWHEDAS